MTDYLNGFEKVRLENCLLGRGEHALLCAFVINSPSNVFARQMNLRRPSIGKVLRQAR
jgi:hypothetical protein